MPDPGQSPPSLDAVADALLTSYLADDRTQHFDAVFLPSRQRVIDIIELLRRIVFPGFFDDQRITTDSARDHVRTLLGHVDELLYEQVRQALRFALNARHGDGRGDHCDTCDTQARGVTDRFFHCLPRVRTLLGQDVRAAFEGDPAAHSCDEAIFCYPGIDAIFTHRLAHELYRLDVPLIPRIMSEIAHSETGCDIHPGATIGGSLFIDHGTGVVIGETCTIGQRVKIYQGVTLGALSTKGGQAWRGRKRHPTIEDDVTLYGGAIILGGETVIGHGATIGGSVFLTTSVPPGHTVTMKVPELHSRPPRNPNDTGLPADFDPGI